MTKISFSCLTTLGALSLASSLSAAPSFYAGLQGGYSYEQLKIDHTHEIGAVPVPENVIQKSKESGFQGGLIFGGDCLVRPKIAIGLQILADLRTHQAKKDFDYPAFHIPLQIGVTKRFTLIPACTLAYVIKPSLRAFLTLGACISQFKIRLENKDDQHILKKAPTKTGFASSIGVEYKFSPRWSGLGMIGLEHYGTVKTTFDNLWGPGAAGVPNKGIEKIKARYITGKIGFLFRLSKH